MLEVGLRQPQTATLGADRLLHLTAQNPYRDAWEALAGGVNRVKRANAMVWAVCGDRPHPHIAARLVVVPPQTLGRGAHLPPVGHDALEAVEVRHGEPGVVQERSPARLGPRAPDHVHVPTASLARVLDGLGGRGQAQVAQHDRPRVVLELRADLLRRPLQSPQPGQVDEHQPRALGQVVLDQQPDIRPRGLSWILV